MVDESARRCPMPRRGARSRRRERSLKLIADELRQLILSGDVGEGDALGREPDLVERFGVSRPSLREALRILETEGLIDVVRGLRGGVVVRTPDQRLTARTAALVLQARGVPLADVFDARALIEPIAARELAEARNSRAGAIELQSLLRREEQVVADFEAWGASVARFHERLVALAGNQTMSIVAEMLNEIVSRAIIALSTCTIAPFVRLVAPSAPTRH